MLDNKSNKQKFRITAIGIVVLIWISYHFSISRTIDLWKEYHQLEQQQALIEDIPEQLPLLNEEIKQLENILGNSEEMDFSTLLLGQVDMLCQQNNVQLIEIPEKHIFRGDNLIVETLNIHLLGRYSNQLRMISAMENGEAKARIRSILMQAITNQVTGERKLESTVFLQSIRLLPNNANKSDYEKNDN